MQRKWSGPYSFRKTVFGSLGVPVQLELTGWPDWPRTWLNSVMLTLEFAATIHLLQLGCIFPVFFDTQHIHARISNTISLSTQTLMDFEKVRFLGALA